MSETTVAQMSMFSVLDQGIQRVFQPSELKDKTGATVGVSVTMKPRKEIADALGLKRKDQKDELDLAILKESDAAFRKVKGELAALNGEWTLAKVATRTLKSGIRQITLVTREVKRNQGPSDEAIAKAWNVPLEQVAEVKAMLVESAAKQKAQQVDIGGVE